MGKPGLLNCSWKVSGQTSLEAKITIIGTYYVACIKCFLCMFLGKSHHEEIALVLPVLHLRI